MRKNAAPDDLTWMINRKKPRRRPFTPGGKDAAAGGGAAGALPVSVKAMAPATEAAMPTAFQAPRVSKRRATEIAAANTGTVGCRTEVSTAPTSPSLQMCMYAVRRQLGARGRE